jgi:hypothetical protein
MPKARETENTADLAIILIAAKDIADLAERIAALVQCIEDQAQDLDPAAMVVADDIEQERMTSMTEQPSSSPPDAAAGGAPSARPGEPPNSSKPQNPDSPPGSGHG